MKRVYDVGDKVKIENILENNLNLFFSQLRGRSLELDRLHLPMFTPSHRKRADSG